MAVINIFTISNFVPVNFLYQWRVSSDHNRLNENNQCVRILVQYIPFVHVSGSFTTIKVYSMLSKVYFGDFCDYILYLIVIFTFGYLMMIELAIITCSIICF